jgi:hypothetical protein
MPKILHYAQRQTLLDQEQTYLSIDLDYWCDKAFPNPFIQKAIHLAKKLPHTIVADHAEMLPAINKLQCPQVVNVDYHSDLPELADQDEEVPLECGTWGLFVQGPRRCFTWSYPHPEVIVGSDNNSSSGFCNYCAQTNPFDHSNPKPICGWERTVLSPPSRLLSLLNLNIVGVGFCLSREWFRNERDATRVTKRFHDLAKPHLNANWRKLDLT